MRFSLVMWFPSPSWPPATLSARLRVLGSGRSNKNDANDARAVAIAAALTVSRASAGRGPCQCARACWPRRKLDASRARSRAVQPFACPGARARGGLGSAKEIVVGQLGSPLRSRSIELAELQGRLGGRGTVALLVWVQNIHPREYRTLERRERTSAEPAICVLARAPRRGNASTDSGGTALPVGLADLALQDLAGT